MEKETEKINKKSNKGKVLFTIALLALAYMFIFRPLVISYCQKQAQYIEYSSAWFGREESKPTGTSVNPEKYKNCLSQLDPIQNLKAIIFGDK